MQTGTQYYSCKLFFVSEVYNFSCPSTVSNQTDKYADLTDCKHFYQCFQNIPYRMTCPFGLLFNPLNKECDYFHNVNCTNLITTQLFTTKQIGINIKILQNNKHYY